MRKIIYYTVFIAVLISAKTYAQVQVIQNVTPVNLRTFMNNVFQHIDVTNISSGVLMDKGIGFIEPLK